MESLVRRLFLSVCFCAICITSNAQTTIQMEKVGGVYKIPCTVNGLRLKMIFDSGASNVCISENTALMMLENDYLSVEDIKGSGKSTIADGSIVDHTIINLKKIQIGDKVLTNVEAVVIHGQDAPLLFGQSAIKKLGRYTISGNTLIIGMEVKTISRTTTSELSDDDIDRLFQEADEAYDKGAYSIALEKYKILYDLDLMNTYGILSYADCYYYTERYDEALNIYKSIDIENNEKRTLESVYKKMKKIQNEKKIEMFNVDYNDIENLKKVYINLKADGYVLPSYEKFKKNMADSAYMRKMHSMLMADGWDVPDYGTFRADMGYGNQTKSVIVSTDVSGAQNADAGMKNMSYAQFVEKYNGREGIRRLYVVLMEISDRENIDFGIGEKEAWENSFYASDFPDEKIYQYLQIGRCLVKLEDYDVAMPYLESVKYYAEPYSSVATMAVIFISTAYRENGNEYKAKRVIEKYILDYQSYKNYKPTDCWTKGLRDEFLAELYRDRSYAYIEYDEYDIEKYRIISAAWGDKKSIEWCNKYYIDYRKMPTKYVY